jgi:hypothetical protein
VSVATGLAQPAGRTQDAYNRGLSIISECMNAMGGVKAIEGVNDISFSLYGIYHPYNQTYSPLHVTDSLKLEANVIYQSTTGNFIVDQKIYLPGNTFYTTQDRGDNELVKSTVNNSKYYTEQSGSSLSFIDVIRSSPILLL